MGNLIYSKPEWLKYNKEGKHYAYVSAIVSTIPLKMLGMLDKIPPHVLDRIIEMGKSIEKVLDLHINHGIPLDQCADTGDDKINEIIANFTPAFEKYLKDNNIKIKEHERPVRSDQYLASGKIDLITTDNGTNNETAWEIKTRNLKTNPTPKESDLMQLLLYMRMGRYTKGGIILIDRNKIKPVIMEYWIGEIEKEVGEQLDIAITYYDTFIRPFYDPTEGKR